MIIFKDLLTGDEIFTDSSKYMCIDDCIYEVQCQQVSRKQGDITLEGSNPSAEEVDEGTLETVESGLDVVLNQRLVETSITKSGYKSYLKTYTKALQEKWKEMGMSEDEIKKAQDSIKKGVVKVIANFDKFDKFYIGESSNPDGLIALLEYRETPDGSGEIPTMVLLKHGLEEEKV
ncbi:hypothetical protein B4U80_01965 [Leptotrombidium deliense]|uniref:Translationally-controlled tumor protein homolog n=1 Tax=Leptotrombidium deliense TaxID=299467 RepID=A0A443SAV9_9ACAR|nr:hypothetical protein B4U80_01965 [Leptotrombidium deliense]